MTYSKSIKKYGHEVASFLYNQKNEMTKRDSWACDYKTETVRRKYFLKYFEGDKSNHVFEQICLN